MDAELYVKKAAARIDDAEDFRGVGRELPRYPLLCATLILDFIFAEEYEGLDYALEPMGLLDGQLKEALLAAGFPQMAGILEEAYEARVSRAFTVMGDQTSFDAARERYEKNKPLLFERLRGHVEQHHALFL